MNVCFMAYCVSRLTAVTFPHPASFRSDVGRAYRREREWSPASFVRLNARFLGKAAADHQTNHFYTPNIIPTVGSDFAGYALMSDWERPNLFFSSS